MGFNIMEVETFIRYSFYPIICVINNSGIYHGYKDSLLPKSIVDIPSSSLSPNTSYHLLANIVENHKGLGFKVNTKASLKKALEKSLNNPDKLCVLNIIIDPNPLEKVI